LTQQVQKIELPFPIAEKIYARNITMGPLDTWSGH